MRLLVTAPLTLDPQVLVEQIKQFTPAPPSHLVMTDGVLATYGKAILPLVKEGEVTSLPLDSVDFGICAVPIRQIEMIHLSNALLVLKSKVSPTSEPQVHIDSLLDLAHKYDLLVRVVDI